MIDLHSHILPGIDDGSRDMAMSLAMARMAVADGTTIIACTPHFFQGLHDTTIAVLEAAVVRLRQELADAEIPLSIVAGGDVHAAIDLPRKLANGIVPTLNGTRYFLLEPPHHLLPPNLDRLCELLIANGHIPIITHPERLSWIEQHFAVICRLKRMGAPLQLTAGSITGSFGRRAKYWSERLLDEGFADLVASDAHNTTSRPPGMQDAFDAIAERHGEELARRLTTDCPAMILEDRPIGGKKWNNGHAEKSRHSPRRFWMRSGVSVR